MGESPRWHDNRLWVCDWGARELLTFGAGGDRQTVLTVDVAPFCIDWLPDGTLLVMTATGHLLRRPSHGALIVHADVSDESPHPWNEIATAASGAAYVNDIGFDFAGGEVAPGSIALVSADGQHRPVAGGLMFPNGMRITPDGRTLIVAESYAGRLTAFTIEPDGGLSERRTWAELGDAAPDGLCIDADGAVWYGDVPHKRCVRVREGGDVLETIDLDQGCFACALGGPDGRTLHMVCADWPAVMNEPDRRAGRVLTVRVAVPDRKHPGGPQ